MSSSPTLAGPPGECCFTTIPHTGTPVGQTINLGGMKTYLSEPKTPASQGPKKIILFFPDVRGPFYLNNQLLQDYFASRGYTVLGPDYFFGDPVQDHDNEPNFDRAAWSAKSRKQAGEAVPGWLEAVKEKYGLSNTKYCAVGYCFGGPFALGWAGSDVAVAAALAHPAYLNEDHIRGVKKPLLLSCAEIDHTFPAESRRRAEDILAENKATYHVQLFSGVSHGFTTRGDPDVENSRWAKEESARGIIRWFDRFSR